MGGGGGEWAGIGGSWQGWEVVEGVQTSQPQIIIEALK